MYILPWNIWRNFRLTFVLVSIFYFNCDTFQIWWVLCFFNLWHFLFGQNFHLALATFLVWWWFWCFSGWMKFEKIISKFEPDCDWVSPFLNLFELRSGGEKKEDLSRGSSSNKTTVTADSTLFKWFFKSFIFRNSDGQSLRLIFQLESNFDSRPQSYPDRICQTDSNLGHSIFFHINNGIHACGLPSVGITKSQIFNRVFQDIPQYVVPV